MARTVDTILRDTLGNLQLQIIHLTAQLEAAQEKKASEVLLNPPAPETDTGRRDYPRAVDSGTAPAGGHGTGDALADAAR